MSRRFSCLLTIVVGVLTFRMTLSGEYLNYVRPLMFPWLLISAAILLLLGIVGWKAWRKDLDSLPVDCDPCTAGGHAHGLSKAAWLLVLPVVVVSLTASAPLGSYAANRSSVQPPRPPPKVTTLADQAVSHRAEASAVAPAPAGICAVAPAAEVAGLAVPTASTGKVSEMSLIDFLEITYYDETQALAGVPVTLVGFAMPVEGAATDKFLLSRFMISCCAADSQLMQAGVIDTRGVVPAQDSWVAVTGTWQPSDTPDSDMTIHGFPIPKLTATEIVPIPQPENPYLSLSIP